MSAGNASSSRSILRECALLLGLAAVAALLAGWLHPKSPTWSWSKPGVAEVELSDVLRWPPPVLWVDARTVEAYGNRHIPGAISLNEGDWERLLPGLIAGWQPNSKVVVYCDSQACDAAQAVALRLQHELGLGDIHVLKGGWATWLHTRE